MNNTLGPLIPIGTVRSTLTRLEDAPRQGVAGGPEAWLDLTPEAAPGIAGIAPGDELILLTWLHLANRDVLQVHTRGDRSRPATGVFNSRSPERPNPIGLHRVRVLAITGSALKVAPLEAIDGTPLLDIKPARSGSGPDAGES